MGTAFLLAAIVGSGIMGERLAGGNGAVALLANTLWHFNPAVTLADASQGGLSWREVPGYVSAQAVGSFTGVAAAHAIVQ